MVVEELTKLLINQYEKEKKTGQAEYIKVSVQDFYRGLIKFLKEINYDNDNNI